MARMYSSISRLALTRKDVVPKSPAPKRARVRRLRTAHHPRARHRYGCTDANSIKPEAESTRSREGVPSTEEGAQDNALQRRGRDGIGHAANLGACRVYIKLVRSREEGKVYHRIALVGARLAERERSRIDYGPVPATRRGRTSRSR